MQKVCSLPCCIRAPGLQCVIKIHEKSRENKLYTAYPCAVINISQNKAVLQNRSAGLKDSDNGQQGPDGPIVVGKFRIIWP